MLPLFELGGGGKGKGGIDREPVLPKQTTELEEYAFIPQRLQGKGRTL